MQDSLETGDGGVAICRSVTHNSLWGSIHTDINGNVVEELLEERTLVCLNDGKGTRIDVFRNILSCIDLKLVSRNIAFSCEWNVDDSSSIGIDHFPILCTIDINVHAQERYVIEKWCFEKANWEKFQEYCIEGAKSISMDGSIEECYVIVTNLILKAASKSIPIRRITGKRKAVPWWNEGCTKAVRERNKALRVLRSNLNQENSTSLSFFPLIKAQTCRAIKGSKNNAWREYCSTIGREVKLGDVWQMLKKMSGKKKYIKIPVLEDEETKAVTDKEKAKILGKSFANIHSGNHLDDLHRKRKEQVLRENQEILRKKYNLDTTLDNELTMSELEIAINGTGYTATEQDQLSYAMFRKLPDQVLSIILELFNKIWREGSMPKRWKSALILPFSKPGKNPNNAGNYRPIALTSHLCKWMEKILVRRLNYFIEQRGLIAPYQNGFRKGRSTMDTLVKVNNEIEKAFKMKELMVIVFFDIEKAYDSMWREGLLIQMSRMGISGRFYNWVLDFLSERNFRVKVGPEISDEYDIVNGIPQGSVISPVLFNIMINGIFMNLDRRICASLYADDGAIWIRGRDNASVLKKIKEAILKVEQWSYNWGFKISTSKSATCT